MHRQTKEDQRRTQPQTQADHFTIEKATEEQGQHRRHQRHVAGDQQVQRRQRGIDRLGDALTVRGRRLAQHVVDDLGLDAGVPDAQPQAPVVGAAELGMDVLQAVVPGRAAPERGGTTVGNCPSLSSQTRPNKGKETASVPTVVANGGLSSAIRLSQTRLAE